MLKNNGDLYMMRLQCHLYIVAVLAVLLFPLNVLAQSQRPADVRVVIDISGSMKSNDPQNLRQPALELLVKLLPEGSKSGVWTFGQYINMLVPHRQVNDQWRAMATAKAAEISSLGLYTNIGGALEKATFDSDSPNLNYRTSVILLTDGMVDIDKSPQKNQAEWRRIVDQVLPDLKRADYTLHTIALSKNADTELMNKLALATDGIAAVASSADDLLKIFLQALDQAAPAEQVPLDENKFVIDSSVEEFTALIFRQSNPLDTALSDTVLYSPDKTAYSFDAERTDVNWYHTDQYDLITLKQPLEGTWRIEANMQPDSRVTVVSNLNLLVKPLPSNLFVGDNKFLSLLLQEDGTTLTRAEFLRLIQIDAVAYKELERNGSEHGSDEGTVEVWSNDLSGKLPPGNGIYTASLNFFEAAGRYQLNILLDGKSFQRQYTHNFTVREPFGVNLKKEISNGRVIYHLIVSTYSDDVNLKKTKIVAKVKNPKGRTSIKPLQLTDQDNWLLEITPDIEGRYQLALRINGVDKRGRKFGFDPENTYFQYPDRADPFSAKIKNNGKTDAEKPEPELKSEPVKSKVIDESIPYKEPDKITSEITDENDAADKDVGEQTPWLLYALLAGGNLVILLIAFFAYRMIMGGKKEDPLQALEKSISSIDEEVEDGGEVEGEEGKATAKKLEQPQNDAKEPAMDDVVFETEASDKNIENVITDGLEVDSLDISDDSALAADLDLNNVAVPDNTPAGDKGVAEDDDLGFSMDDFSNLGDDEDEAGK